MVGDWFEGYWFGSPVDVMGSPELGQVIKNPFCHSLLSDAIHGTELGSHMYMGSLQSGQYTTAESSLSLLLPTRHIL